MANDNWPWWPLLPLYPYGQRKTLCRELIPGQILALEQLQGVFYVAVPIRMFVVKIEGGAAALWRGGHHQCLCGINQGA